MNGDWRDEVSERTCRSCGCDFEGELDSSGLVDYVRGLMQAVKAQEDESLDGLIAKALREYPMKDIRIAQLAGDPQSRFVEVRDGDQWRVFEG